MPVSAPKSARGSDFEKKLTRYALMGGALISLPAAAHASLITTTVNQTIGLNSSLNVDIDGDSVPDFTIATFSDSSTAEVLVFGGDSTAFGAGRPFFAAALPPTAK